MVFYDRRPVPPVPYRMDHRFYGEEQAAPIYVVKENVTARGAHVLRTKSS